MLSVFSGLLLTAQLLTSIPLVYAQEASTTTAVDTSIACNCYSFIKTKIPDLPMEKDLKGNTTPHKGAVVLMKYGKVNHYALIEGFTDTTIIIRESNYKPCTIGVREIGMNDPHLVGFWAPSGDS